MGYRLRGLQNQLRQCLPTAFRSLHQLRGRLDSIRAVCHSAEDQRAATTFIRRHARRADDLLHTSFLATALRILHLSFLVERGYGDEIDQLSHKPSTVTFGPATADLPLEGTGDGDDYHDDYDDDDMDDGCGYDYDDGDDGDDGDAF